MDYFNETLLWVHFMGLAVGLGSGISLGTVAAQIIKAPEDGRERLWAVYATLTRTGHVGLGLLILSGLILVFTKFGGVANMSVWFWVKMVLVVVLIVSIGFGVRAGNRVKAGDAAAMPIAQRAGMINGITAILIVMAAVLAFN